MKNLKKVLAMVLAFACTFTMFASAVVYDDVPAGSKHSEAITMLSDLGIIQGKTDGKYHPEATITRAEACALIARLLTGDPNVANFGNAQSFTDVVKGSWMDSPIGYCVANGITVGVGNGKFEPNRAINDQEFITMMVRALGYETPDMKQNYPFSYMTVARTIGLVENTEMMAYTDALRDEDAQVIYNAMFVDYAKGAKMLNTTHGSSVEKYPTLAESVWGLERAAVGTWDKDDKDDETATLTNCKAHTWVIVGADKEKENRILAYPIEDDTTDIYESDVKAENGTKHVPYSFKYEGKSDIDTLKGYQVELWGEGKHGKPVWEKGEGKFVFSDEWNIKAIKSVKDQTKYDYDASKADAKADNGTIELGENKLDLDSVADNAKKVTAKNTTETTLATYLSKVKYNGETIGKDEDVEKALNVRDGAQYKLMDWDSDGDIDWVVIDEANYYKVESASSKRVTVTSMKSSDKDGDEEKQTVSETKTWKIGDLNDEKNYKVKYEVPEDLKEGDILEVTYKTAYDKGEKCEVVTATVTVVDAENHKLDKVSTKNHLVLTFDGETVELAQNKDVADTIVPTNPTKYIDFDEEELGMEFALTKNRNGFIVYSDYATDSANYLMVLDTDDGKNTVRGELGAMKIITNENKVESNVEVVSDLRIDGKTSGNGYDKDSRAFDEHKIVGNVYKYWKDADGKITKLESMVSGKQDISYEYVAKNDRLTLANKESYALKDAKIIFAVKPHDHTTSYIQHIDAKNLKIDDADVLAVKQADVPDISKDDDTKSVALDMNTDVTKSWIANSLNTVAMDADNNKDIKGAVLGVNNFNKFNAGATKVGLVTNVSYDSNGVVSLDVATNGKVDTVSSAEKVDFEDIVSVKDYQNNTTESVGSRTETINVGIMKDSNLKDSLYKNGAYAEITTDADGKLTGVLFMDEKTDKDGATVNAENVVAGNYYQVSRKVIADVKTGSWMSVVEGAATYADKDSAFASLDTKNIQKASDFASDAAYYVIDGAPTRDDGIYNNTKATILAGFDGTPDIKVGEASDVVKSEIRNNNNNGDSYNVADVASKIDNDGAGDIVAVYAFSDDMDEVENYVPTVPAATYKITAEQFAGRVNGAGSYVKTGRELYTKTGNDDKFAVYVGGEVVNARAAEVGVEGLTKDNFKVTFGNNNAVQPVLENVTAIADQPGFYELDLNMPVDTKRGVTVEVVKNGSVAEVVAGGMKVEDAQPEIGETNVVLPSDEETQTPEVPGAPVGVDVVTVTNSQKTAVVKIVDEKGLAVKVNNITVPEGSFVANTDGSYTLTSSATLSEVTIIVDGKPMKMPKMDADASESISATGTDYKLMTGTKERKDITEAITRTYVSEDAAVEVIDVVVTTDTGVTAQDLDLTVEEGAKKVTANVAALNKLNAGDKITFKIQAAGVKSADITVKITAAKDITATATVFDPKAKTITLTMDGDYTGLKSEIEAADWNSALKTTASASNIITAGGMELEGAPVVAVADGKTTVTLTLKLLGEKINTNDSLTGTDVIGEVTLASGTKVKPATNVTISRGEIKPVVSNSSDKAKVIVEFGKADIAEKIFADATAANTGAIFAVTTGTDAGTVTTSATITASTGVAIGDNGTSIELTIDDGIDGDGDDQKYFKVVIKGTQYYKGATSDVIEVK